MFQFKKHSSHLRKLLSCLVLSKSCLKQENKHRPCFTKMRLKVVCKALVLPWLREWRLMRRCSLSPGILWQLSFSAICRNNFECKYLKKGLTQFTSSGRNQRNTQLQTDSRCLACREGSGREAENVCVHNSLYDTKYSPKFCQLV